MGINREEKTVVPFILIRCHCLDTMLSKGRRGEYELEQGFEGSSQGLIDVLSRHFPEAPEENHEEPIVMANIPAEI